MSDDSDEEELTVRDNIVIVPAPPSPEVPRRSTGVWWLLVLFVLVMGYPLVEKADAWLDKRVAATAKPELECRAVELGVQTEDGNRIEITRACLPVEVWAKYAGHNPNSAATRAALDYLRGDDGE